MALEIKSVKVPRDRSRVEVVFQQPRKDESVEEYKVKLPEQPAPSFNKALDGLRDLVIDCCNLYSNSATTNDRFELHEALAITALNFKASELGLMVGLTAEIHPADDRFPDWEIKVEPMLIVRLSEAEGKLINKIERETRKYLKGFRSQADLFQGSEGESEKPPPRAQKDRNGNGDLPK